MKKIMIALIASTALISAHAADSIKNPVTSKGNLAMDTTGTDNSGDSDMMDTANESTGTDNSDDSNMMDNTNEGTGTDNSGDSDMMDTTNESTGTQND